MGAKVREFPGIIRAARRVDLAFSVKGKLELLDAREGRIFEKGEVIARLDQRDFEKRSSKVGCVENVCVRRLHA